MRTYSNALRDYARSVPTGIIPIGFDVETFKITNQVAPEVVCASFFNPSLSQDRGYLLSKQDAEKHLVDLLSNPQVWLIAHNANFDSIASSLISPRLFPLFMRAYLQGRIHCTKLREALLLVSCTDNYGEISGSVSGRFAQVSRLSLAGALLTYYGKDITDSKVGDVWRLKYHTLAGVPVDSWESSARDYAIGDAEYALAVYLAQETRAETLNAQLSAAHNLPVNVLGDAQRQATSEFCLMYMSSVNGVRVNPDKIGDAKAAILADHKTLIADCVSYGLYKAAPKTERGIKADKSKITALFKRAYDILRYDSPDIYSDPSKDNPTISTAAEPRGILIRLIDKAIAERKNVIRITLDAVALTELELIKQLVEDYARAESLWKETNTFLNALEGARLNSDNRLRYVLNGFVSTGRSSSKSPNMQNLPRGGATRACIEAAPGKIFVIADYSNAEMRTLAEVNYVEQDGNSELAREYRKDPAFDPHLFAAFKMWNIERAEQITFKDAKDIYSDKTDPRYKDIKRYRTLAKILNFGLAGGLSHVGFVSYARGYNVNLSVAESERLCSMWLDVWGEMQVYFNTRAQLFRDDPITGEPNATEEQRTYLFRESGRARYLRKYTVACNTPFQGIAADGAKEAVIQVFTECYFSKRSPLYGCTPILFVHDEIVLECAYDGTEDSHKKADAAARRLGELMVTCMERYTPNIPALADANLATMWTKDAESDTLPSGLLSIWSPSEVEEDIEEVEEPKQITSTEKQLRQAARASILNSL